MAEFDIFSVFTMMGGLAFFLYGMNVMSSSLEKLTNDEVKVRVIHSAVGGITEGDVMLADASNALIVTVFSPRECRLKPHSCNIYAPRARIQINIHVKYTAFFPKFLQNGKKRRRYFFRRLHSVTAAQAARSPKQ